MIDDIVARGHDEVLRFGFAYDSSIEWGNRGGSTLERELVVNWCFGKLDQESAETINYPFHQLAPFVC